MFKIHESGENYLETILVLHNRGMEVRSIDIASELGFSKPSISRAVNILKSKDYITVDKSGVITFTKEGKDIAEKMYERHCLLRDYLISLGVNEETASQDACRMEHVISEESFIKIKEHVKDKLI